MLKISLVQLLKIPLVKVLFLLSVITACKSTSIGNDKVNDASFTNTDWQMQEIRFLKQNTFYYYKRKVSSGNNINFDNDFIKFNSDGTGSYHQTDGIEYPLKWHFTNDQKTTIKYVIENFRDQQPLTVHWEHIDIKKGTIKYTEYYTHANGINSLAYVIRVSK